MDYELPDGSAFTVVSMPLGRDHWIYQPTGAPPMPLRMEAGPDRERMVAAVWAASRYAVKAATMSGREPDFDPDAMAQSMVVGLIGYHTSDGLTDNAWGNPKPIPPVFRFIEPERKK